jgi:plasmid stability protein
MANVTIRNLDDKVVVRLKKRAKTSNRSLEAELREILTRAADTMTSRELRVIAERIAAITPDVPQTDSAELIREDRDR